MINNNHLLHVLNRHLFLVAEAPEEEYDPRSLFERLEANRVKKQEEFDEAHRLSKSCRVLVWFLGSCHILLDLCVYELATNHT